MKKKKTVSNTLNMSIDEISSVCVYLQISQLCRIIIQDIILYFLLVLVPVGTGRASFDRETDSLSQIIFTA